MVRSDSIMLRYLGFGERRFGMYPMGVNQRINWEIYAVLEGRIAPVFSRGKRAELAGRRLWVFPPGMPHGWVGDGTHPASITVFHFGIVPQPLDDLVRKRGYLEVELTSAHAQYVGDLAQSLMPHFLTPTEVSPLHYEAALLDLSLLVLPMMMKNEVNTGSDAQLKVERALAWARDNLAEKPRLETLAKVAGVSVSHMRRLFWTVRGQSPHKVLMAIKMQRALEVMSHSDKKLEAVAVECGFSCAIDFCRAFKGFFGTSPTIWRKIQLPTYNPLRKPLRSIRVEFPHKQTKRKTGIR